MPAPLFGNGARVKRFFLLLCLLLTACNQDAPPVKSVGKDEKKEKPAHLVETARVLETPWQVPAVYTGSLRARRILRVHNQETGKIERLPFHSGDQVEQGALLVQLDQSLLKAQIARAEASLRQARSELERLRRLAQNKLVAEDELVRAETARAVAEADLKVLQVRLGYTRIDAPFSGIVSERLAEPGDAVGANSHLLSVIDPASLIAEIEVSEYALAGLAVGQSAEIQVDALGGPPLPGTIARLPPALNPLTRQGLVEIAFARLPAQARSGQFCRATLHGSGPPRKHIPYTALRRDKDGEYVFVLDAEQRVRRQAVSSGEQLADRIEILAGLEAGQTVVSKGFLGLQAGSEVKVVDG
jgi:RND family efflux transporter MFP subunit